MVVTQGAAGVFRFDTQYTLQSALQLANHFPPFRHCLISKKDVIEVLEKQPMSLDEELEPEAQVMFDSLPEDTPTTVQETLEGDFAYHSVQFVKQIMDAKSAMREHQGENITETGSYKVAFSRHLLLMGENIVDIFLSESDLHRNTVSKVFSDGFEDFVMDEMHRTPLCCSTLEVLTRLFDCQGRLGGEHLVKGLNKTILVGEMIKKRCTHLLARCGDIINQDMVAQCQGQLRDHAIVASRIFFQVGDRKRFGDLVRLYSEYMDIAGFRLPQDIDVSSSTADDEIWHYHKKIGMLSLACINCGAYEESNGKVVKKHNMCGQCFNALYCSKECQYVHWQQHKKICKEISKEKKASQRRKSPK